MLKKKKITVQEKAEPVKIYFNYIKIISESILAICSLFYFFNIKSISDLNTNIIQILVGSFILYIIYYITNSVKYNYQYLNSTLVKYFLIILCTTFLIISYFSSNKNSQQVQNDNECNKLSTNLGILLSNFKGDTAKIFTDKTFNLLNIATQDFTDISISQFDSLIYGSTTSIIYEKALRKMCYNSGIVIGGSRNEALNQFDCIIYLHNFMPKNTATHKFNGRYINIQNPDYYNFSVDYQSAMIVEFITALLHTQKAKYKESNYILERVLNKYKNHSDVKFLAACSFLAANNYLYINKYDKALHFSEMAYYLDPTNVIVKNYISALKQQLTDENPKFKIDPDTNILNSEIKDSLIINYPQINNIMATKDTFKKPEIMHVYVNDDNHYKSNFNCIIHAN